MGSDGAFSEDSAFSEDLDEDGVDSEMEAICMFHTIDKNNSGAIEFDELHSELSGVGMSGKQIKELMHKMDLHPEGGIDMEKWVHGYSAFKHMSGRSKFHHLRGPTGGVKIEKTELRAIELEQLEKIYTHVKQALKRGSLKVSRPSRSTGQWIDMNLEDPKEVNLYDTTSIQSQMSDYHESLE